MAKQLLDRPDVSASLEQVRRKGMTEGMTRHAFSKPRFSRRDAHGTLNPSLM